MANGIQKKVLELQKRVTQFGKDKTNTFHKYAYASAEGVNDKIKPVLLELGIVSQLDVSVTGVTVEGMVIAKATLILTDTEDGSSMTFGSIGSGIDNGDKGAMKAATAASKYATIAAVFGSTGDDPEADSSTDSRRATTTAKDSNVVTFKGKGNAAPEVDNTPVAVVITTVDGPATRSGRQPFKIKTAEGEFQSWDKKLTDLVVTGAIVIYKVGRFGNDIIEVKGKDGADPDGAATA